MNSAEFDRALHALTDDEFDEFQTQMMVLRADAETIRMSDFYAALSSYAAWVRDWGES